MAKPYGKVVRELRDDKGWTQETLAKRAGVSRDTIVRAEQSGNVGVLHLYRIAAVLDVNINDLFGGGAMRRDVPPPSVWSRLEGEQLADVLRYARRLLGEQAP